MKKPARTRTPKGERLYAGADPEPVDESVEIRWLDFMRRFNELVYPQLYAPFGISRDMALLSWQTSYLDGEIRELREVVERGGESW